MEALLTCAGKSPPKMVFYIQNTLATAYQTTKHHLDYLNSHIRTCWLHVCDFCMHKNHFLQNICYEYRQAQTQPLEFLLTLYQK